MPLRLTRGLASVAIGAPDVPVTGGAAVSGVAGRVWPYRGLLAASLLARLPISMSVVGLLTLGLARGFGPGVAGTGTGLWTAAVAVSMPLWGRRAGTRGPRRVLAETLVGQVLGLAGLLLAGDEPAGFLLAATVMGATTPPLNAVMRATWNRLFAGDEDATGRMATLETMISEVMHIIGRLVVAVLAAASAWLIPVGQLLMVIFGWTKLRADQRLTVPPSTQTAGGQPLWRNPTLVAWAGAMLAMAASHGAAATAMVVGASASGGWQGPTTMAVWASGSLLAGAWTLSRADLPRPRTTLLVGQVGFAAAAVLLWLAQQRAPMSIAWLVVLLLGAPITPTISAVYRVVGAIVPTAQAVQVLASFNALIFLGFSAGTAAAGWAAEGSEAGPCLLAAAAALLAALPALAIPQPAARDRTSSLR